MHLLGQPLFLVASTNASIFRGGSDPTAPTNGFIETVRSRAISKYGCHAIKAIVFQTKSHEDKIYIKFVCLKEIHDFVVGNFFICNHLDPTN